MKISVILPCFNGAATLTVQLEALTQQQWSGGWDVIVVNNGSTDESMVIVAQYCQRLPDLRIVEAHNPAEKRQGVAHSYTVGMQAAGGDAFVFCEADDEVSPTWLEEMGQALETHDFVVAALEYHRLNPDWLIGAEDWLQQSADVGLSTISPPLYLPYGSGCSFGLRRSVYETVGDPDLACMASWDTDYCWRAHQAGIELHFAASAVIHYRLRQTSAQRYRQSRNWAEAHVVLLKKYAPPKGPVKLLKHFVRKSWGVVYQMLKLVLYLNSKKRRLDWLGSLGWSMGELQGSFKYLLKRPELSLSLFPTQLTKGSR